MRSVQQSYTEALNWFRKAAEAGAPEGYFAMGYVSRSGRGVKQDYDEAVRWWKKAAEANYVFAFYELGTMYELGWGVPQDVQTAVSYLSRAASEGVAEAQVRLGQIYRNGKGATQDYPKARELFLKAAQQGNLRAENALGFMLANGEGGEQNPGEAAKWFLQAADRGYAASQYNLGFLYLDGKLARNPSTAALWIRRSAEQGHRAAESLLGRLYRDGTGVPKDYVQAYMWLNLAAASGDPAAAKLRDDLEKLMTPERIGEAQALANKWKPQPASVESAQSETQSVPELDSMGTGFLVTKEGYVITNFHVIDGCSALFTERSGKQQAFSFIGGDPSSDLALLKLADSGGTFATFRGGRGPGLGEAILAAGYPLPGTLASTLNVTTGNISALAGIGDDASKYQITAPVQPGNSGGPVFDPAGNVIGVVVAKLNALNVAKVTGDIPQNVNFAIKSSIVTNFLDANGIRYSTAPSQVVMGPTETSRRASTFTIAVECWK